MNCCQLKPDCCRPRRELEGDEEIGLLDEDVGGALAPGIGATGEERMVFGDAVDAVPGEHERDAEGGEGPLELRGGLAGDAAANEEDGALRGAQEADDLIQGGLGDGLEAGLREMSGVALSGRGRCWRPGCQEEFRGRPDLCGRGCLPRRALRRQRGRGCGR